MGGLGGVISGGLAAVGASKQSKEQKKIAQQSIDAQFALAEHGAAERERLSQKAQAEGNLAKKQRIAAEEAAMNVFGSLGAPGTYDMPESSPSGPISGLQYLAPSGIESTKGLLTSGEPFLESGEVAPRDVWMRRDRAWKGWMGKPKKWKVEGEVMDPDAAAGYIKSTSGFRQVSRLVAESEQLLNRRGRLWEELNNSIVGGIYEGTAAFQRQAMEELSREMGRGGSARNRAMAAAQKFQIQEGINRQRTGALWQSKMALEQWVRANAAATQNFAMAWTGNQFGIRDTFTANLTNLSTFWTQTMTPALMSASVASQTTTQQGVLAAHDMFNEAAKTKTTMYAGLSAGIKGGISLLGTAAGTLSGA
jgi:hypothetical protein